MEEEDRTEKKKKSEKAVEDGDRKKLLKWTLGPQE